MIIVIIVSRILATSTSPARARWQNQTEEDKSNLRSTYLPTVWSHAQGNHFNFFSLLFVKVLRPASHYTSLLPAPARRVLLKPERSREMMSRGIRRVQGVLTSPNQLHSLTGGAHDTGKTTSPATKPTMSPLVPVNHLSPTCDNCRARCS